MRYVRAKVAEDEERHSHRMYTADALMLVAKNTARFVSGDYITQHWAEILTHRPDARTGAEIAADVMREMGLGFEFRE